MKILESNKVLQSVFSGMAINYLNTEYQNGYIRDIYNECKVVMNSSNSITVSTGMIVVEGIRLLFDEAETFNITSFPDSSLLHHLVLKVTATTEGENKAEIINRINEPLRQDEILKTGSGVYELELASYLLSPNGISNFAQTLLPIILTNEELQSFKEMIDALDKKVDALDQVIITANEDAERALTTVSNLTVGTVQKGVDPEASIEVDVIKKTAKLNLTLPKGDKGDNGTVITIDGEPQDYWDATHSQKLYEESSNELDLDSGIANGLSYSISNNSLRLYNLTDAYANYQIDLSHLKGQTITLSIGSVNVVSGIPFVVFYADADIFNKVASNGFTKTFTVPTNANTIVLSFYANRGSTTGDITLTNIMLNKGSSALPYHPYNQNRHITNSEAEFLKYEFEKSKNQITFGYGSGNNEYSNGTNSTLENNKVILTGTPTLTWANMSNAIERKIDIGDYVLSINKAFSFSFAMAFNHADGTATTGYIYKGNISNKVQFTKEVISYRIYFEDLVVGQTYDETVEVQLERGHFATDVRPYQGGDFAQIGNIKPTQVWENTQPNVEFISKTASFSESVLDASLVRIDVRRNNSSYAGTLSFFVKPDALGGSIPLSASFVEGSTEYRISRTCTFYNHAGLYFDNAYLGTTQNNNQMIPMAIYKYKY